MPAGAQLGFGIDHAPLADKGLPVAALHRGAGTGFSAEFEVIGVTGDQLQAECQREYHRRHGRHSRHQRITGRRAANSPCSRLTDGGATNSIAGRTAAPPLGPAPAKAVSGRYPLPARSRKGRMHCRAVSRSASRPASIDGSGVRSMLKPPPVKAHNGVTAIPPHITTHADLPGAAAAVRNHCWMPGTSASCACRTSIFSQY